MTTLEGVGIAMYIVFLMCFVGFALAHTDSHD